MTFQVIADPTEPDLMFLPWDLPLIDWPNETTVSLPQGISRHIVRFVRLHGIVYAVKETQKSIAEREYEMLQKLGRLGVPCVERAGVISGRLDSNGEELPAALMTRHLEFSLPYRALFSSTLRPETASRLLDALALLLVRLHLVGFYWGDCSLSNTLFRRDAGSFAAYLVDAETGELHEKLTNGQRSYDLDLAVTNATGEFMDLAAAELLHDSIDPFITGEQIRTRYERLWTAITEPLFMKPSERFRLDERIRLLNEMGFDIAEMESTSSKHPSGDEYRIVMTPKVVDAGHHTRRLLRLTGLDVEENQARRLLNDLDQFRIHENMDIADEELAAHKWVTEAFEPVLALVPKSMRARLEPAEIFHEVLQHRWYLSETAGKDVGRRVSAKDYIENILVNKPEEQAIIGAVEKEIADETQSLSLAFPQSAPDIEHGH